VLAHQRLNRLVILVPGRIGQGRIGEGNRAAARHQQRQPQLR
jgi:hypothetical protein